VERAHGRDWIEDYRSKLSSKVGACVKVGEEKLSKAKPRKKTLRKAEEDEMVPGFNRSETRLGEGKAKRGGTTCSARRRKKKRLKASPEKAKRA